ncbi:OmpA family protein [Alphaproteobacteria bacterium KMM 3653]|uniref:OmpA family protein n=1 Tax=Harenicola maris TaxID=2841044 RepID=A0AAP2CRR3_9RHOB|nr:OmpA family protein [Harenicola maris]
MRLGPKIIAGTVLLLAAGGSYVSANLAAEIIERGSGEAVQNILIAEGHDWASVTTDGLQVRLSGTAPTEASRFRALSATGRVVDAARVIDEMEIEAAKPIAPPRFSIELLRNDAGISMIGLIPAEEDREALNERITRLAKGTHVTDLLEVADYPVPTGWSRSLDYGLRALDKLPRSKISIASDRVSVTAISESIPEKRRMENQLEALAPEEVVVALDITAPRPVISPFTTRFLIEDGKASFDACSVDSEGDRTAVLAAANLAGLEGEATCTLGLGAPTPDWSRAVIQGIQAVADLGEGSITFADADVTLVAVETTSQADFDRVVGALESNLPDVFSLSSVLPEPDVAEGDADEGPPEFVATRSPEGQVALRGRIPSEQVREVVTSFARARFGSERVYSAARVTEDLPDGWPVRVLAGLTALGELHNGAVVVQPEIVEVRGETGNPSAKAEISRILSEKLGEGQNFTINVTYRKVLDPLAGIPTPQECGEKITAILDNTKISFEPGSTEITGSSIGVVDEIAEVLKACHESEASFEIGAHSDSQGGEEMNLALSQQRADAVLNALIERRVLTTKITAKGYGETTPIADNDTEAGREANRRIEFRLTGKAAEQANATEQVEDGTAEAEEDGAGQEDGTQEEQSE